MARQLSPVGLDFVDSAPVRLVFARELTAPPAAVYRALAEDVTGWPAWFKAVTLCRPTADGAGREVKLIGGTRFQETILAAEPDERYAYRVDTVNAPGLRALVEEWLLTPSGTGTRVQWTFAADASAPIRIAMKAARPGMGQAFKAATGKLDERLSANSAQS
ncbi:SRPBCC family protein [Streptomyces cavernicola]|uniref:SRPBCC family protein n=1 Tax=Streptomyces cavernicola TaxID=3043613 RepID=A0ABT6S9E2_9ACTN|nr:SRPBCC family protein [Streptomyces sp. B-S-A6]MDI3404735.1 SRPBCC family protein [Streptomyces sp. B-S-A6]